MLYEFIPNVLQSNYDPRKNPRPHVNDIIGSTNAKNTDLVTNYLKDLYLKPSTTGQAMTSYAPT
jgi:hypothetical protein